MVPEKKSLGPKERKIKQPANCTTRESFFSHVRPRREQRRAGRVAAQRHRPKLRVSVLPSPAQQPRLPLALRRPSQDQGTATATPSIGKPKPSSEVPGRLLTLAVIPKLCVAVRIGVCS